VLRDYKRKEQLYAQSALQLGSSLFWNVTQRTLVGRHRSFGTTYGSQLQGSSSQRSFGN